MHSITVRTTLIDSMHRNVAVASLTDRCPDPVLNKLRIFGISIAVFLGCIASVYMAIASAESQVGFFMSYNALLFNNCTNAISTIDIDGFIEYRLACLILQLDSAAQVSTYSIIIKVVSSAVQFNALAVNFNFRTHFHVQYRSLPFNFAFKTFFFAPM
jgi:hypothetical protein